MKSKKIQSLFEDFNSIVTSGPVSSEYAHEEKQRRVVLDNIMKTYYSFLNSNGEGLMKAENTADIQAVDEGKEIYSSDIIDRMTDVINVFNNLRSKLLDASSRICKNGAEYFSVIGKKYNRFNVKLDKREEADITKRYRESYKEIMGLTKNAMVSSVFLDALVMREYRALKDVQMGDLFTLEELYAREDELVNPNLVDYANDIESSLVAAFWLNKVTKIIEDCKQGYIIERTMQDSRIGSSFSGYSKEQLLDISIKRYKFLNQVLREAADNFYEKEEFKGFQLSEYIMYLYYKKGPEEDPVLKKRFEIDSPEKQELYSKPEIQAFTDEIFEYEERYNELLSSEDRHNEYGFINDLQTMTVIHDCMQSFYDAKTELTAIGMLAIAAAEKSNKMITGSPRWGVNQDDKLDEDRRVSRILVADLPGYLKPVSLHLEKIVYDAFKEFHIEKEYEGVFDSGDREYSGGLGVNILFKLREKEITRLRQLVNKKKQQIIDNKRLLERIRKGNKEASVNPNALMRGIIYDMQMYKVQREMCAIATREYAKWLGEDKIVDAPLDDQEI